MRESEEKEVPAKKLEETPKASPLKAAPPKENLK
jgi:hypothetical protein